jgi:futalosine hydrolase
MRILVVTATEPEAGPVRGSRIRHDVDILVTGVGMVATAAQTSRALAQTRYNLALNFGVCGSFDRVLVPGSVVHVVRDRIAELGAEDGDRFVEFEALQLPGEPAFVNAAPPANAALGALPAVTGITVNTVHGSDRSIAAVVRRLAPQVESMEGAAFMYACLINGVPFAQVRSVSNIVERRNRDAWQIGEALTSLGRTASSILECI